MFCLSGSAVHHTKEHSIQQNVEGDRSRNTWPDGGISTLDTHTHKHYHRCLNVSRQDSFWARANRSGTLSCWILESWLQTLVNRVASDEGRGTCNAHTNSLFFWLTVHSCRRGSVETPLTERKNPSKKTRGEIRDEFSVRVCVSGRSFFQT